MWEKRIEFEGHKLRDKGRESRAFTLVELLMVLGIISMLMGMLLPVLDKTRRQTQMVLGIKNQRDIVNAVTLYAADNDGRFPESVATVGLDDHWNWTDPRKLTANQTRAPGLYRAMSEYLRSYISNASVMFCTNAPTKYKYLQQSWDAGDDWNNPDTFFPFDPVGGTFCFYWNYIGCLSADKGIFRGPQTPAGGPMESKLLVTDYFGYDCHQEPNAFGSCDYFNGASVTPETWLLSSYWFALKSEDFNMNSIDLLLHAGYTDGHIERYNASDVIPMRISITSDGSEPYPDGVGPGIFYLPRDGLH